MGGGISKAKGKAVVEKSILKAHSSVFEATRLFGSLDADGDTRLSVMELYTVIAEHGKKFEQREWDMDTIKAFVKSTRRESRTAVHTPWPTAQPMAQPMAQPIAHPIAHPITIP